jgi:hypothetical protein
MLKAEVHLNLSQIKDFLNFWLGWTIGTYLTGLYVTLVWWVDHTENVYCNSVIAIRLSYISWITVILFDNFMCYVELG